MNRTQRRAVSMLIALLAAACTVGVAAAADDEDGGGTPAVCDRVGDGNPGLGNDNGAGEGPGNGQSGPCPDDDPDGPGVDLPAPFTEVTAFATKTGYRGVVAWSAATPILPIVTYGTDPEALDQTAPVPDTPDTAGMVLVGDGRLGGLEIGTTYYVSVTDQISGVSTPPIELLAANAYEDLRPNLEQDPTEVSFKSEVYTIDLLVQIDTQALDPEIPADVALADAAAGVNVMAERLYDALDGHARLGTVLVTDTNVYGAGSLGTFQPVRFDVCDTPTNVADFLLSTNMPFDSHTYSYAINSPCTPIYLGRIGQLVVPWEDDLHLGYTATHEIMHYAFGAPDLYGTGDVTGTDGGGCRNLDGWDGSLMHNSGGWNADRWELTEVDRDPVRTPCDHGSEPYTWDRIQERYRSIPDADVEDVFNNRARGNPDGGALDILVLDREPGASTLTHVVPDDGAEGPVCVAGLTETAFTDPAGDAASVLGTAQGPSELSDPALDLLTERVRLIETADEVVIAVTVEDLREEAATGSVGEFFDIEFVAGGQLFDVVANWDRTTTGPTFQLYRGLRDTLLGPVPGTWDLDADTITVRVPASFLDDAGTPDNPDDDTTTRIFGPGDEIRGFATTARRDVGVLVPDADTAAGGCALEVPGGTDGGGEEPPPDGPDATLTAVGDSYAYEGEPTTAVETFVLGPVPAYGTPTDRRIIDVVAPEGAILVVDVAASPTSYVGVEVREGGQQVAYTESPAGAPVTLTVPAATAVYEVLVQYFAAAEATFTATVSLAGAPDLSDGTPDGTDTVGTGDSATFAGTAPSDNVNYTCAGPFDPRCRTYLLHVADAGLLTASVESLLVADDFDIAIHDSNGAVVASGGFVATVPGFEFAEAEVEAGSYYVVVQPFLALGGVSAFTATVSLD